MPKFIGAFFALLVAFAPPPAQAYIGPGLGLGAAASVLGLFLAFILLLVGLIWLPIRRILRQRKKKGKAQSNSSSTKL